MPVRLPARVPGPPAALSWLTVSAVMVRAVVAPSPAPATTRAPSDSAGRGTGERRPEGRRFPEAAAVRSGLAAEDAHAFTGKECGSDGDNIMKSCGGSAASGEFSSFSHLALRSLLPCGCS